jgi:DNA polymerase III epsilon subunit-like protein
VLRQAFERAGIEWPAPPVLCTVALAARFAPLVRQRRLAALAGSLGIDVEVQHRALPDAETCARVFCALFAPAVRCGDDDRGGARGDAAGAARAACAQAAPTAGARCAGARKRRPGRQRAARRAGRLHLPQRVGPAAVRRQVRDAAHARASALRPVVGVDRTGRCRPSSSTTARRARSWARCCSSAG